MKLVVWTPFEAALTQIGNDNTAAVVDKYGQAMEPRLDQSTPEFIFEEIKSRLAYQNTQVDSLDAKANFVLVSSSVLLVAAATVFETISRPGDPNPWGVNRWEVDTVSKVLIVAIVASFIVTFLMAGLAYRPSLAYVSPNPRKFASEAWSLPLEELRTAYVAQLVFDFEENEETVLKKAGRLQWSFTTLGLEAILMVLLTAAQI